MYLSVLERVDGIVSGTRRVDDVDIFAEMDDVKMVLVR